MLLTLFSGPYALLARWAILALACAALFGYGYVKGHHSAELDFERFKAKQEALAAEQQAHTDKRIAADIANKQETDHAHEVTISNLRDLAKRVRVNKPNPLELPAAAANTQRPELACFDRAEFDRASGILAGRIRDLAAEGSEATVDLNAAKQWALKLDRELR
jgi:hypothetical protein